MSILAINGIIFFWWEMAIFGGCGSSAAVSSVTYCSNLLISLYQRKNLMKAAVLQHFKYDHIRPLPFIQSYSRKRQRFEKVS